MRRPDSKSKSAKQTSKKRSRQPAQLKEGKATLREYLTRASETAEKATSDRERASFTDADALPSIARDLKHALACLDRTEHAQTVAPVVDKDTRSDYQRRADQFAAALAHPDTPNSFRKMFKVIYDDLLINKTNWSHPSVIRATYAAMREHLDESNYCGDANGIDESLLRLIQTQLPAHVQEAARRAGMKGGVKR
jgi:hypothetical protein